MEPTYQFHLLSPSFPLLSSPSLFTLSQCSEGRRQILFGLGEHGARWPWTPRPTADLVVAVLKCALMEHARPILAERERGSGGGKGGVSPANDTLSV